MLTVQMIRDRLYTKLRNREFVADKSGVSVIELVGESFLADEPTVFGTLNEEWSKREVQWYESQSLNVNDIPPPVPTIWQQVADKDGFINSNYGWMIWSEANYSQYENVVSELRRNPSSRRAVMIYQRPSMWAEYDLNGRSDFCCTNAVNYFVRDGAVHAVVQMRSNDLVFGYKGDRYWQWEILNRLAKDLELEVGDLVWNAASAHVYERHFRLVEQWFET